MFGLKLPPTEGIGSQDCESLSSYVQRLAAANATYPGQLVYRMLAWLDRGVTDRIGDWSPRPGRLNIGRSNNCFHQASIWLSLLGMLDPDRHLDGLTTRRWDREFPTRGFQHNSLHWCPLCLAEDHIPYLRLLWMLFPSRACARHEVLLAKECPRCHRPPAVLHDRSLVLNCPWCAGDLREAPAIRTADYDFWTETELGRIVGYFSTATRPLDWNPRTALVALCTEQKISDSAQLARAIGTSRLTTWYWLTGKARPSLPMVLRIYSRYGGSLAAEMMHTERERHNHTHPAIQLTLHLRPDRRPRTINWKEVRASLQAYLRVPLQAAPTLLAVSKELRIERRMLRGHEPALCLQISERHRQKRVEVLEEKSADLQMKMKTAILSLMASGQPVTKYRIEGLVERPGLFNGHLARKCFDAVVDQLGLHRNSS